MFLMFIVQVLPPLSPVYLWDLRGFRLLPCTVKNISKYYQINKNSLCSLLNSFKTREKVQADEEKTISPPNLSTGCRVKNPQNDKQFWRTRKDLKKLGDFFYQCDKPFQELQRENNCVIRGKHCQSQRLCCTIPYSSLLLSFTKQCSHLLLPLYFISLIACSVLYHVL